MANQVSFLGYSRGSGRTPFLRVYEVTFSGTTHKTMARSSTSTPPSTRTAWKMRRCPTRLLRLCRRWCSGRQPRAGRPELEIGGNGTAGEVWHRFWAGGDPPTELGAVAYSAYSRRMAPTIGQVLIGVLSAE